MALVSTSSKASASNTAWESPSAVSDGPFESTSAAVTLTTSPKQDVPVHPGLLYPRRQRIVHEILATEQTYVEGLQLIEKVLYAPLRQATIRPTTAILPTRRINDIFANLTDIINVNQEFLRQLEARLTSEAWSSDTSCVGDIFIEIAPYFKMYAVYMRNFQRALASIRSSMDSLPAFRQLVQSVNALPELKNLSIESYLMLPIQRLPRYRLLLAELVQHTPSDHVDYPLVTKALAVVQDVANFVNDMIRQHDMHMAMVTVQRCLMGFTEKLIVPGRKLIKRGPVKKICRKNHQPRELFLFTDILIYASPALLENTFNFHRKLPLEECTVIDVPDSPAALVKNVFQIYSRDKSFGVYTDTARSKQEWVGTLHRVITEHINARQTLRIDRGKRLRSRRAQSMFVTIPTMADAPGSPLSLSNVTMSSVSEQEPDHESSLPSPSPLALATPTSPRIVENYNAPVWIPDEQASRCLICYEEFNLFRRKHHCRACGHVVCHYCSTRTIVIPGTWDAKDKEARACDQCVALLFGKEHLNDSKRNSAGSSSRGLLGSSSYLGRTRAGRSNSNATSVSSLFSIMTGSGMASTPDLLSHTTLDGRPSRTDYPGTSLDDDRRRWSAAVTSQTPVELPRRHYAASESAASPPLSSPTSPKRFLDYGLSTARRMSLASWTYGFPRSAFSSTSLASSHDDQSSISSELVRSTRDLKLDNPDLSPYPVPCSLSGGSELFSTDVHDSSLGIPEITISTNQHGTVAKTVDMPSALNQVSLPLPPSLPAVLRSEAREHTLLSQPSLVQSPPIALIPSTPTVEARQVSELPKSVSPASHRRCQLCLNEFTVFRWRNLCNRCRRAVCSDCLTKRSVDTLSTPPSLGQSLHDPLVLTPSSQTDRPSSTSTVNFDGLRPSSQSEVLLPKQLPTASSGQNPTLPSWLSEMSLGEALPHGESSNAPRSLKTTEPVSHSNSRCDLGNVAVSTYSLASNQPTAPSSSVKLILDPVSTSDEPMGCPSLRHRKSTNRKSRRETQGKLCDVCALGLDPDRVVVNPDGSGWSYGFPT
ncbi:hypothetical protein H4R34_002021 [Dimargaris verticillata]|uniref:Dbl homology domain-containing protein n=1 Tax=Dimargaris verticillata TaxID=2761393 RepID=A0A9W8B3B5_9FUNG|nr:hypothetical protein H4R34_002021 [Dimargaris verticillata]